MSINVDPYYFICFADSSYKYQNQQFVNLIELKTWHNRYCYNYDNNDNNYDNYFCYYYYDNDDNNDINNSDDDMII